MDKYYSLTDKSPAYMATVILHLSHKWHYINQNWKPEWAQLVRRLRRLLKELWGMYKPVEPVSSLHPDVVNTTNDFLSWRN